MTSSDIEMRSPVLTSMSYSRGGWVELTELARWMRSSVVLPMALTTATTSEPCRRVRAMWSATARILSASPTEVPPNFWTISGIPNEATDCARLPLASALATGPARSPPLLRGRLTAIGGHPADWVGSAPVPSDKRARQRAAREARLAAEAKAQKRRRQIRNGVIVVIVAGVVIGIVFAVSGNNPKTVGSQSSTSTTLATPQAKENAKLQKEANQVAVKAGCPASPTTPANHQTYTTAPPMTIDTTKSYSATVVTTAGTFDIALNAKAAPKTVNNFVFLANKGYFHCNSFFRVIPGFINQAGSAAQTNSGTGRRVLHPAGGEPAPRRRNRQGLPARLGGHGDLGPGRERQPVLHRRRGPRREPAELRTPSSAWSHRV